MGFPTRHVLSRKGTTTDFALWRGMVKKRLVFYVFLDFALSAHAGSALQGPPFRGSAAQSPPPVSVRFDTARASRAQPEARAWGKRRGEDENVFLAHAFYKTGGQSVGVTKKTHQGTRRRSPEGNRAPRRSATRFRRRSRTHSALSNRNCKTGARSLVSCAVRRPSAKHIEGGKRGFSKVLRPLLLWWRARDATNALF